MALRTLRGIAVRVDRESRLHFASAAALVLERGAIYVDSGASRDAGSLEVRTPFGIARDIGTRFEVKLTGAAVRVRVRDGLVRLTHGEASHEARPGDELTLDRSGGLARRAVPAHGADWAWAAALAKPFELEGRLLREFLDWIATENAWQLRFDDAAVERKAATARLHGSIRGLSPEEALAVVLPTVGVEYRLADGTLTIRLTSSRDAK